MKIQTGDFWEMSPTEKQAFMYSVLGFTEHQIKQVAHEFFVETGKKPNALFLAAENLMKIPTRIKKINGLTVIPMDSKPDQIVVSQVDPWDKRWEHLFYS
ncbi:hypothetical protein ACTFSJ_27670 [Bacillus cereus group sp. MYBK12-2]|uniref:hypothetical protein n=1 Tax=Bacillus cereus group sp. MYBK12-2 TaxID=3450689 RepID=UPI0033040FDD|nr:hypothetical protein [Bacillus pacificus]HDR7653600.1 hypothetical protein [Bacillus pacificus]